MGLLPIHGFVLAGGKSTRMGDDKALLPFCGRPMVEIAVEKLRSFCVVVSIAGNRDDLARYADVVHEMRVEAGPAAGVEAGLKAAKQPWVLCIPVDVPLVPSALLRLWCEAVMERGADGCVASYLTVDGDRQPAFCLMKRDCVAGVMAAVERGERRLARVLASLDGGGCRLLICDAALFAAEILDVGRWFVNVNTPEELAEAKAWVRENVSIA
jgi:molybdopterin-guanine dinucleotide biosynthesis protein A